MSTQTKEPVVAIKRTRTVTVKVTIGALRRHTHLIGDFRATFRAVTTLVGHTEPNDAEGGQILKEEDQALRA